LAPEIVGVFLYNLLLSLILFSFRFPQCVSLRDGLPGRYQSMKQAKFQYLSDPAVNEFVGYVAALLGGATFVERYVIRDPNRPDRSITEFDI
jgi:hypothetical protein